MMVCILYAFQFIKKHLVAFYSLCLSPSLFPGCCYGSLCVLELSNLVPGGPPDTSALAQDTISYIPCFTTS